MNRICVSVSDFRNQKKWESLIILVFTFPKYKPVSHLQGFPEILEIQVHLNCLRKDYYLHVIFLYVWSFLTRWIWAKTCIIVNYIGSGSPEARGVECNKGSAASQTYYIWRLVIFLSLIWRGQSVKYFFSRGWKLSWISCPFADQSWDGFSSVG